ncbi:MAG: hypothetical protein NUV63_13795 [Gallionella sp.]|nr:hypothetical protein [Gallionella sp.]
MQQLVAQAKECLVGRVTPADATQQTAGVTRPTLDGWNTQGNVTFNPDTPDPSTGSGRTASVTLNEISTSQTRLSQVFVLNEQDRYLSFTLSGAALDDLNGALPLPNPPPVGEGANGALGAAQPLPAIAGHL